MVQFLVPQDTSMNNQELIKLNLEVSASDASEDEIDAMTRQLLSELKETNVESASLVKSGSAPEGTKSVDPVTAGAIAIAVLPGMLSKIIETIQAWVLRGNNRTVKFKGKVAGQTIDFEGSADDLQKLLVTLSKGKKK